MAHACEIWHGSMLQQLRGLIDGVCSHSHLLTSRQIKLIKENHRLQLKTNLVHSVLIIMAWWLL